jgi:hypothetical protein
MHYDEYCCHLPYKLRREINEEPKRWILTLPMFEYIHELAYETYVRYGGDVDAYNRLFEDKVAPLLDVYHRQLHTYRFEMRLLNKSYESIPPRKTRAELVTGMFKTLVETRDKVRHIYFDFVNEVVLQGGPNTVLTNLNDEMEASTLD